MGNSKEEIFLESELSILKNIFKEKGYPENFFLENQKLFFSYSWKIKNYFFLIKI